MNDQKSSAKIVKDISLLYELSLSVGLSLQLQENCDSFLKTLMARKNLAYAAVWIKNIHLADGQDETEATLVYANPQSRMREEHISLNHPLFEKLKERGPFSLTSVSAEAPSADGFRQLVTEKDVNSGTITVFPLKEIGLLKLFSPGQRNPFPQRGLDQLRNVIDKFAVSLEGCLVHQRMLKEASERQSIAEENRSSEAKFRTLYEATGDAVMVLGDSGFISCNQAALKIFGYDTYEQFLNTHPGEQSPPTQPDGRDSQVAVDEYIAIARREGSSRFEWEHRRTDGSTFPAEVSLTAIQLDGQMVVQAVVRDITERKQAEEKLTKRAAEFETVAQVSAAAATSLDADHLLQEVVDLTKLRFNLYHAHIYLLNDVEDTLVLTAGAGQVGRQMVAEGRRIPLQQEQSLVAQAARLKRGIIVNDVRQNPNFLPHHLLPETQAEMAVPMLVGDRVLGVLDVQADKADYFIDEDQRIQTILANQVAIALDNVRLLARTETTLGEAQRLATIVENQTDFMGVSDLEGNALYINPAGLEMMGLPRDYDISALTIVDFFPAEDAEVLINEGVSRAREHGAWTREAELLRVDGKTIPVDKSVTVNYDANQQLYSFNIIMRDISIRKAAEADREALLEEVQATIRQYVHQQWDQFLGEYHQGNWRVQHQDPHSVLEENEALLEQIQQAVLNRGETQILAGAYGNGHQSHAALVSPIPLRGQVIGTLSLEDIDPDRNWSEDEIALVEAVSEQLALTIENLRLVENTQKRATREQLARQITDKMRTFPDADAIIRTGLDELVKALGVSRTYVKLNLNQSQGQE